MRKKTARRFLKRNQIKMNKRNIGIMDLSPSFLKRWKKATEEMVKD